MLCDLKKLIPGKGPVCSLTSEKPTFTNSCNSIKLKKALEEKLAAAIEYYETTKFSKGITMLNFYTYLGFSIVTIAAAFVFHNFLWNGVPTETGGMVRVFSVIPFVLGMAGITLLGYATGPLRHYKTHLKLSRDKLEKLSDILKVYNKSFDYEVEIVKRRHENPEKQAKCTKINVY